MEEKKHFDFSPPYSCASAADDVGLKRQRFSLNGSYVPRMRPVCGIPLAMPELEAARHLGIYMQHSTISEIAVATSAKMPSAVVTFLLSAVLLALCEYGPRVQIGYNL
jgi:hypothetical protein